MNNLRPFILSGVRGVTDVQLRTIFGEMPRRGLASLDPDWPSRLSACQPWPNRAEDKVASQKGSFSPAYHNLPYATMTR